MVAAALLRPVRRCTAKFSFAEIVTNVVSSFPLLWASSKSVLQPSLPTYHGDPVGSQFCSFAAGCVGLAATHVLRISLSGCFNCSGGCTRGAASFLDRAQLREIFFSDPPCYSPPRDSILTHEILARPSSPQSFTFLTLSHSFFFAFLKRIAIFPLRTLLVRHSLLLKQSSSSFFFRIVLLRFWAASLHWSVLRTPPLHCAVLLCYLSVLCSTFSILLLGAVSPHAALLFLSFFTCVDDANALTKMRIRGRAVNRQTSKSVV